MFRYTIQVHRGRFSPVGAAQFGLECGQPLMVVPACGDLRSEESRLRVEPSTVQVSAFKPSDDGKALIVRLFGASNQSRSARIEWGALQPRAVFLSDTSEKPGVAAGQSIVVPSRGLVTVRAELP